MLQVKLSFMKYIVFNIFMITTWLVAIFQCQSGKNEQPNDVQNLSAENNDFSATSIIVTN